MPTEMVAQLAEHPNIIGIKESSGSIEKIAAVKAATQHVKRTYNVTEVFNAVTGRMLQGTADNATTAGGVIPAEALTGSATTVVAAPPKPKFKMRTREVSFQIAAGAAQMLLPSLEAGAGAAVLAFSSAAPTACYEVYAAWKDGDKKLAEEKQLRISATAKRVAAEMGIPALKYAMDLNGYYGGPARLPLLPLTAAEKTEVEQLMRDLRN
jgi:4-hydroxy-2-oxoglutarate aldolase